MTPDTILAPVAALTLPEPATLNGRAQQALQFVESFEVVDSETFALAADELRAVKARAEALEEQRTSITKPINAALRAVNALFAGPAALLDKAESVLKGKMLAWSKEQQRIADEQRRKAEEIAAAERRRLEEQAAAQRREAEQRAKEAAQAKAAGDAQAAALAHAEAMRAQAMAQQTATTAQLVVAAPPVVQPAKVDGISTRKQIDFKVTDLHALVKHVAERPELLNLLKADEVKLRAYVRGVGTACALPGVLVFEDRVMSVRSGAGA